MKYERIKRGQFVQRVNRFVAEVIIDGKIERVHVKNTGRLKELLQPNAVVLLEEGKQTKRKTKYSLIAAYKDELLVNIDSLAPNKVVHEALVEEKISEIGSVDTVKKEVNFSSSRFDLYYEKGTEKGFIEVKGVTLEKKGVAMFPDAPTIRGTKHLVELMKATEKGYTATIIFLLQMANCHTFMPNHEMDQSFSDALLAASKRNVRILAYDTMVFEDQLLFNRSIPVTFPSRHV
ncbi:DNA/RNA nuclease SfsA [Aliibacillus thermotolerans]|uniref:Sugar fermentation stimulation protein homolog n=1 Tax=Aliibacillus thermotolerans TaxID=1834418 RepID=A0ABW0U538_9BACI|nr:DNA/RNA nuclease SfsA [Aliibacillus thermotolerans]MDA3128811.1 DNA/RNA nuclease SfsA [Aliibacillus thermotolerans]